MRAPIDITFLDFDRFSRKLDNQFAANLGHHFSLVSGGVSYIYKISGLMQLQVAVVQHSVLQLAPWRVGLGRQLQGIVELAHEVVRALLRRRNWQRDLDHDVDG